jgi:hypothetical protein
LSLSKSSLIAQRKPAWRCRLGRSGRRRTASSHALRYDYRGVQQTISEWIATAKHPKTGKLYTDMVYQPMLELLAYLRVDGFKTFIVSGGGIEFMRPWTEKVYGIPPEQVVGSTGGLKFEIRDRSPVIMKLPTLVLNDDKEGKPVASNVTSVGDLLPPSATPMATCRCYNGLPPAAAPGSASTSITPMPSANGPTTASRTSANSTKV